MRSRSAWPAILCLAVTPLVFQLFFRTSTVELPDELWASRFRVAAGAQDRPAGPPAVPGLDGPVAQAPDGVPAAPFVITPVEVRTTAEMVAEQQVRDAQGRGAAPRGDRPELEIPGRKRLPLSPASPQLASWPPGAADGAPVEAHLMTTGTTIEGPTLASTNAFPPDTMGEVGPAQYFITLNGRMRVYNKASGVQEFDFDPDTFFSATVRNNADTTDPRIRFDRLSGRWFIVYITIAVPNRIVLAVSSGGTITAATTWTFSFIANTVSNDSGQGCLGDYETLGIDASALYIGVNQFCGTSINTATFFNTSGFVVNKASLIGGSGTVTLFSPLLNGTTGGPVTPQGADNIDPAATVGYFVGVDALVFGELSLVRISNPGTAPSASVADLTVPATSFPLNAPHAGGTRLLDALDDRLMNALVRSGRLYTAHAIGVNAAGTTSGPTRSAVRWYELENLTTTPTLRQAGTIFDGAASNPLHYFVPSININGAGDVVVGYAASSATSFAGAAASHRRAADALGTMQAPITVASGVAAYNPPGNTTDPYRWGDYSMVSVDPSDDATFWTAQMYTSAANVYGTRAVRLTVVGPPTSVNDSYSATFNTTLNVLAPGVLANDLSNGGGAMTAGLVSTVSQGVLVFNTDGSFGYTPPAGFTGTVTFTYRAINPVGPSATAATVTITVLPAAATPNPPTGLYVATVLGSRVTLRWTAPASGPPATGFLLKGGINPSEVLAAIPTGSAQPLFTFDAPSGAFYIRMHTLAGAAESGPSNEVRLFVNVPQPPSAPVALLGMVNGANVALSWNNTFTGGAPSGTVLDVTGALVTSIALPATDNFSFAGVPPGSYTLALRAVNGGGSSGPSNEVTLTFPAPCSGTPEVPANFIATKTGSLITVYWDAPVTGVAPTAYVLSVSGSYVGTFATSGRTLSGVVGPGSYTLSVLAANPCGNGPATPPLVVAIP